VTVLGYHLDISVVGRVVPNLILEGILEDGAKTFSIALPEWLFDRLILSIGRAEIQFSHLGIV
jgi:hypothetical protein